MNKRQRKKNRRKSVVERLVDVLYDSLPESDQTTVCERSRRLMNVFRAKRRALRGWTINHKLDAYFRQGRLTS